MAILKDRRPEERDDARIPTPESIKTVTEGPDGRCEIEKNWRDGTDGCERGSREMALIKAGTTIDRIGSCEGKYCSPLNENGSPYSIKERATGDRMVESPIENNSSYHRYEVKQDLTRENISAAIDKHYSGEEQEKMHEKLDKYFQDCCNSKSHDHRGDIYSEKTANEVDGIKTGKIDHMFEKDDGGGRQFIMPFSVSQMEDMGLIEEKE